MNIVVRTSIVDVWAIVLLIYIAIRLYYEENAGEAVDEIMVFKIIMLYAVYVYVRQLPTASTILNSIIISASLQAIIVILQKCGCLESRHYLFAVTGTFDNPAQVAGFMAIGVIVAISVCRSDLRERKLKRAIGYGGLIVLQIVALCYADSRASFIAILAGIFFIKKRKLKEIWTRRHQVLIPILLLVVVGSCIGVFQYRPDSAKGRILIWHVSCDMIADEPIWGHGIGSFDKKYMLYQADYFAKYPESHLAFVADNVNAPYNELLRIAVELGIIGVSLILFLFFRVFQHHPDSEQDSTVKGALVALLVFAMFSYPGNVLPLLLLFSILVGLAESRTFFSFSLPQWERKALPIICIIGCIFCLKSMCFYTTVSKQTQDIILGHTGFLLKREVVERLLPNSTFSNFYAHYIRRNNETVSESLMHYLPPTCETYCYLGDIYAERKFYDTAEAYYKKASHMIPTRLTPSYKMWNLYLLKGDTVQAIQQAKYIQKQKLKVENSFTIKAKTEVKKFLAAKYTDECHEFR